MKLNVKGEMYIMKKKIILTVTAAVVIAVGIGGYFVLSDNGAETASAKCTAITTVFEDIEETLDERLTDLYAQEMVEAGEMSGDVENEEIEAMDAQMYAIKNVNLREGTAVTTTALRTIQFGEQVHVTGISTNKQWYQVEDAEKGTGYVASNCLSDTKPTQNSSEAQKENPEGTTDLTGATKPTPQPQPSGGGNNGGGSGPGGVDLDAVKAALGGSTGTSTTITPAGENSGSNHGITMAQ
ncbi:MAG: SH3 domain-containing protein [Lachnospiraceae bacterium]|nr:SH3 domain-containing protein [Lachnospiraceae bacterium]